MFPLSSSWFRIFLFYALSVHVCGKGGGGGVESCLLWRLAFLAINHQNGQSFFTTGTSGQVITHLFLPSFRALKIFFLFVDLFHLFESILMKIISHKLSSFPKKHFQLSSLLKKRRQILHPRKPEPQFCTTEENKRHPKRTRMTFKPEVIAV